MILFPFFSFLFFYFFLIIRYRHTSTEVSCTYKVLFHSFHLFLLSVQRTTLCLMCLLLSLLLSVSKYNQIFHLMCKNDGRIHISLGTDGTLKFIYQRRTLHYSNITVVRRVIVHLFSNIILYLSYFVYVPRSLFKKFLELLFSKVDRRFIYYAFGSCRLRNCLLLVFTKFRFTLKYRRGHVKFHLFYHNV